MSENKHKANVRVSFHKYLFLVLVFLLFLWPRFIHLPESINFGSDQGRDFLATWNIYSSKQISLIGPPSEYSVNGRQFFFGPAPYYVILPALILGHWDPLFVSYYLILLNAAVLITALVILDKYIKDKSVPCFFAIFYIFTPLIVRYTQSYWNPYFMLPASTFLLSCLVAIGHKKVDSVWFFSFVGFILGLGLQFHYSFILAIILSIVWLAIDQKLNTISCFSITAGFILGFSPVIIFELRNQFYNLNTLLLILKDSKNFQSDFRLNISYFLSLIPFLFFFLSLYLSKIYKKRTLILSGIMGIFIILSLFLVISAPRSALDYPALKQISKIIINDKPTQFNIVDQMTRDNRAMALRYLLTVHGILPLGVEEYPEVKTLYVYSQLPLDILLKNPVWEISSGGPFPKLKTWDIENKIVLYRLDK